MVGKQYTFIWGETMDRNKKTELEFAKNLIQKENVYQSQQIVPLIIIPSNA